MSINQKMIVISLIILTTPLSSSIAASTAKAGATCSKVGITQSVGGKKFTCVKSGSKLVWNAGVKVAAVRETVNQSNASRTAHSYLSMTAFSRTSLIKQLEFEGYSNSDATYGVDKQNADWNSMAIKAAKSYLTMMPFSRASLLQQLQFEGYTLDQATIGVDSTGLK